MLATPGPTMLPENVLGAMHRQPIDLYGSAMEDLTQSCLAGLRSTFGTKESVYIYIANGHGAWEAALTNVLSRGDKVLALESGLFATAWADLAQMLGAEIEILPGDARRAVDPNAVEKRLRADKEGRIKAILVVHVETASSVVNDIPAIRAAIDAAGTSGACTWSMPSPRWPPCRSDGRMADRCRARRGAEGADAAAGLAFIAAGPRAEERVKSAGMVNPDPRYGCSGTARKTDMKHCGTAPEHRSSGSGRRSTCCRRRASRRPFAGTSCCRMRCARRYGLVRRGGGRTQHHRARAQRSNAVTTVLANGFDPLELHAWCDRSAASALGTGMGGFSGRGSASPIWATSQRALDPRRARRGRGGADGIGRARDFRRGERRQPACSARRRRRRRRLVARRRRGRWCPRMTIRPAAMTMAAPIRTLTGAVRRTGASR